LKCAEILKDTSYSVLLIEKNEVIGPKTCGGGLTPLVNITDFPEEKTMVFNKQNTVLNGKEYTITFISPLRTIDRFDLGQYQLSKIINSKNIKLLIGTKVNSIDDNRIVTTKGVFQFKYLVGADGSHSITKIYLGLSSKRYYGICCSVQKVANDLVWEFKPNKIGSGYFWVFPHKNHTNIGIYFNPSILRQKVAIKFLRKYIEKKRI